MTHRRIWVRPIAPLVVLFDVVAVEDVQLAVVAHRHVGFGQPRVRVSMHVNRVGKGFAAVVGHGDHGPAWKGGEVILVGRDRQLIGEYPVVEVGPVADVNSVGIRKSSHQRLSCRRPGQ